MDKQLALDMALALEGTAGRSELDWMYDYSARVPPHLNVVQVGNDARVAAALAFGRLECAGADPVVIVDHFYAERGDIVVNLRESFDANMQRLGNSAAVEVIELYSVVSAFKWRRREIGLLSIDCANDPIRVQYDLDAWCPLLGWDGILAARHYVDGGQESQSVVDKWMAANFDSIAEGDTFWSGRIRKPLHEQMGQREIWHPHPSNHWLTPGGPGYGRYEWVRSHITQGQRVLDIGCNCGQFEQNLYLDRKCAIVGIDIVREFVKHCQFHMGDYGAFMHADFARMANGQLIELSSGGFDVVTALDMIEALDRPELVRAFASHVKLVLKHGGKLIITTPLRHRAQYARKRVEFVRAFGEPVVEEFDVHGNQDQASHIGAVFTNE